MLTISVQMAKKIVENGRVELVQRTMYDEAAVMKTTNGAETLIGEAQEVETSVKVTAKKMSVKKSPNQNQYPNVVSMWKFRESYPIWVEIFILSSYQISCQLKQDRSIHKHMKMKLTKKKRTTKKVDKGKLLTNLPF